MGQLPGFPAEFVKKFSCFDRICPISQPLELSYMGGEL